MRRTLTTALLLALVLPGCAGEPREEQRKIVVKARGAEEAYDALSATLVQRYDNVDPEETSRERGEVVTSWRRTDEPNRLVRTRARGKVRKGAADDERVVEVQVERQLSSAKTDMGELDRERPQWTGGADTADVTLEREILLAVRQRLSGKIQGK
jgi:hypothetical protein